MTKEILRDHLEKATTSLVEFTRTLCDNALTDNYQYIVTPNQASSGSYLNEAKFPF